jgi:hypothetical protein
MVEPATAMTSKPGKFSANISVSGRPYVAG